MAKWLWGCAVLLVLMVPGVATPPVAAQTVTLRVHDAFVLEHAAGKGHAAVLIVLSKRQDVPVSVTANTVDGTATSGADFAAVVDRRVEVPAGQVQVTLEIPITVDDVREEDEQFTVVLSDASGATLLDANAIVAIVDDDRGGEPDRDCGDDNPYTIDDFDGTLGHCTHEVRTGADDDGDGVAAAWVGGQDCDDGDAAVSPGALDIAGDQVDNDCDGLVDGRKPRNCSDDNDYTSDRYHKRMNRCLHALEVDADHDLDGAVAAWVGGPDCDDADAGIRPGATDDVIDSVDRNCDGLDAPVQAPPVEGVRSLPHVGPPPNCPPSATCSATLIDCGGLPTARAQVAVSRPTNPVRGVLVAFLGSEGTGFYDGDDTFVPQIIAEGFILVRVNWSDGWNNARPHGPYGLTAAACRTATLVRHLHDTEYAPLGLSLDDAVCGFCLTGNSAGALQGAYLLARYGFEDILDAVVLGGGPIPSRVAEACLQANDGSTYGINQTSLVDLSYGVAKGSKGPCGLKDPSYEETWRQDSLVDAGVDFHHEATRVVILIGGLDHTSAPNHATDYYDRLVAEGSPMVTYEVIPTAGHGLSVFLSDPAAQAAVMEAITWEPSAAQ